MNVCVRECVDVLNICVSECICVCSEEEGVTQGIMFEKHLPLPS